MYLCRGWVLETRQFFATHGLSCPASRIVTKNEEGEDAAERVLCDYQVPRTTVGLGLRISRVLLNHAGPSRDPPSQSRKEQREPLKAPRVSDVQLGCTSEPLYRPSRPLPALEQAWNLASESQAHAFGVPCTTS